MILLIIVFQVSNSRGRTELVLVDATESLFNEKDQKKLIDEKHKQEKQLTDSDWPVVFCYKGK